MKLTGSEYHLLLYVIARTNQELSFLCRDLRRKGKFYHHRSEWYITTFFEYYNFVPLRDELIETLSEATVKEENLFEEKLSGNEKGLLKREFAVLRELNTNGIMNFTDIDKKYRFDEGRAQYSYHKMLENGLLQRVTITMRSLPVKYIGIIFLVIDDTNKFDESRPDFLVNIIKEDTNLANYYSLVGDIGTPYGVILFRPVFDNKDLEAVSRELSRIKGASIKIAIATDLILGELCLRKFDSGYSRQYETLLKFGKLTETSRVDYLR